MILGKISYHLSEHEYTPYSGLETPSFQLTRASFHGASDETTVMNHAAAMQ